jgi:hypothetical protein
MCVSKEDGGHILLGEFEEVEELGTSEIVNTYKRTNKLTKVGELRIVQNPQTGVVGPLILYYPTMFIEKFIKESVLNDMTVEIDEKDYIIFEEEAIDSHILDKYSEERSRRSGIVRTKEIPKGLKLVNP